MTKKTYEAPRCEVIELEHGTSILDVSGIVNGTDGPVNVPGDGDKLIDDDFELFGRGQGGWSSEDWD